MGIPDAISSYASSTLLISVLVFLLSGMVKGVVGMGLPTVAMGLLAVVMTPAQAAALLILPSLFTNLWQAGPRRTAPALMKRLWPLLLGAAAGTLAGAWFMGAPAGPWASIALGTTLILYAGWGLFGRQGHISAEHERGLGLLTGAITGLVTAATGVFVIPAVPYLQALGLSRDSLIQAMGMAFTVSTLALACGLRLNNAYPATSMAWSLFMLLPAILGMAAGQALRRRLAPAMFRKLFLGSLILLGLHMLVRQLP